MGFTGITGYKIIIMMNSIIRQYTERCQPRELYNINNNKISPYVTNIYIYIYIVQCWWVT
jgi:hypothetical protein